MEATIWELTKGLMTWVIFPLLCVISYFFKKNLSDMATLQTEVNILKIQQAVSDSHIQNIREDIKELGVIIRISNATIAADIKALREDIQDVNRRSHPPSETRS